MRAVRNLVWGLDCTHTVCNAVQKTKLVTISDCFRVKSTEVLFHQQNSILRYKTPQKCVWDSGDSFDLKQSKMLPNSFYSTQASPTAQSNLEIGRKDEKYAYTREVESWSVCKWKHHIGLNPNLDSSHWKAGNASLFSSIFIPTVSRSDRWLVDALNVQAANLNHLFTWLKELRHKKEKYDYIKKTGDGARHHSAQRLCGYFS